MRETILGNNIRKVPSVAVGCMRLSEKSKDEMNHFIHAALEQGAYLLCQIYLQLFFKFFFRHEAYQHSLFFTIF